MKPKEERPNQDPSQDPSREPGQQPNPNPADKGKSGEEDPTSPFKRKCVS